MLVLTRKEMQSIVITDNIVVTIRSIEGNRVKIGIEAPAKVRILRQEIADALADKEERQEP